tara:strand:+ start:30 stop:503 length:474 start_codon:yes stop_codon:yes gene_type:complete
MTHHHYFYVILHRVKGTLWWYVGETEGDFMGRFKARCADWEVDPNSQDFFHFYIKIEIPKNTTHKGVEQALKNDLGEYINGFNILAQNTNLAEPCTYQPLVRSLISPASITASRGKLKGTSLENYLQSHESRYRASPLSKVSSWEKAFGEAHYPSEL